MKETRFIAQNKEKWLESETVLKAEDKDPEKLSNLFTQVVDDLSYSRTYYPNRSVRVYLNRIAREYFNIIYNHHKEKKNRFKIFWLDELPQIVVFCRKPLLISLLVFILSLCIGVFSSAKDPQFTSSILGADYVAMTEANIEKGDPMAVYKHSHQVDMFLGITLNNLMVAFRTYVFGAFLSIGTLAILLYNGIMVGSFQFFFIERGLFAESALTIWLHGTLEISSIILAGGAGLTLGSGLVFPGTYSRLQAFQMSAIRSLKLMLGITPIFVMAAVIESFLTRYTDVPDAVRLFLILTSAVFILGYFVVYPWMKWRKGFDYPLENARLAPAIDDPVSFDKIKGNGEILKDAFTLFKENVNKLMPLIFYISAAVAITDAIAGLQRGPEREFDAWIQYLFADLYYAMKTPHPIFIPINAVATSLVIHRCFMLFLKSQTRSKKLSFISFVKILFVQLGIFSALHLMGGWATFLLIFTFLILMLYLFAMDHERQNIFSGFGSAWNLVGTNFGQVIGIQMILLLMTFSFLMILSAPLLYLNTEVLSWNFARTDTWAQIIISVITNFMKLFGFYLMLPLLVGSAISLYFSLLEIATANNLKKSIMSIAAKNNRRTSR